MARKHSLTRRELMAGTAASAVAMAIPKAVFAKGSAQIKVGLIGCGGRGTGAAVDSFNADPGVVIWAMGDLFQDRLNSSRQTLKDNLKDRYQVADERAFVGWDAYKKVLAQDIDYVILATPPGFRSIHLRAAVDANKHIFTEKPIGTDAFGVRSVIETAGLAAQKGLNIVAGTQRRHEMAYNECIKRIHDGQIGEVVACYAYWNQGGLWDVARTAEMTDVEWQLRNWLYFTWIAGDIIVEQHIHNIDVCNWAMDKHPVKATSLAGRQVRTDPKYGHIFDHFATEFEYENGVKTISMCRQIDNTASRVAERIIGTQGSSDANTFIQGANSWKWEGNRPNPYVEEHKHLIAAMRNGTYINEAKRVAETTLTAIMGRMAGYTGAEVTWDMAMNSQEKLFPDHLEFGPKPIMPVSMPGVTKFS
ncbi:MAG: Gfo/Idh/MocA family oxidoreductase [Armatimonadetes bacterium]|nr:Gfo/Idh/MocA family oxidoreductase [Armatimonadota bacterium]